MQITSFQLDLHVGNIISIARGANSDIKALELLHLHATVCVLLMHDPCRQSGFLYMINLLSLMFNHIKYH